MDDELLQAVQENDIESVIMLRNSVDKCSRDRRLVLAASLGHDQIVQYFVWDGVSPDFQHEALLEAAQQGHHRAAKLLCHRARWNYCNEALLRATREGDVEVVKLIGHVAERKTNDEALVIAVSNNSVETVRQLACGASSKAQNETLLVAAKKGYKDIAAQRNCAANQATRRLYAPNPTVTSTLCTCFPRRWAH